MTRRIIPVGEAGVDPEQPARATAVASSEFPPSRLSFAMLLVAGPLFLNVLPIVCTLIGWGLHFAVGVVIAFLATLPLFAFAWSLGEPALMIAAPTACVLACLGAMFGVDFMAGNFGPHAAGISVSEAAANSTASMFHFRDGAVRGDLAVSHAVRGNAGRSTAIWLDYRVAPIVPAGWTPSQPVPAWAGCETTYQLECTSEWVSEARSAVALQVANRSPFGDAVHRAEGVHGLTSVAGAPIVEWSSDPEALVSRRSAVGWALLIIANAGLFLVIVISRARRWIRDRRRA